MTAATEPGSTVHTSNALATTCILHIIDIERCHVYSFMQYFRLYAKQHSFTTKFHYIYFSHVLWPVVMNVWWL